MIKISIHSAISIHAVGRAGFQAYAPGLMSAARVIDERQLATTD